MLSSKRNNTSSSAETNFGGTNSKRHPLCEPLCKGYGVTYLALFSIRILQRAHLCYSKWSFMYHSGKAILLKKMSLIQEYYVLMVFLNTGIKFRESRRMLCLNGIVISLTSVA